MKLETQRRVFLVIIIAVIIITIASGLWILKLHNSKITNTTQKVSCHRTIRVAIYNDTGVWGSGIDAIMLYLKSRGISFSLINATAIKNGGLENFTILIMPGGWAYDYWLALGYKGNEMIKEFVKDGGAYLGICAGAYYASKAIMWEAGIYHYSLGIANLVAIGPKKNYTWPSEIILKINSTEKGIKLGFNKTFNAVYIGGPEFGYLSKNITVLAVYGDDGKPAIVLTGYGKGKIALSGIHLEVRESTWKVLDLLLNYLSECKK